MSSSISIYLKTRQEYYYNQFLCFFDRVASNYFIVTTESKAFRKIRDKYCREHAIYIDQQNSNDGKLLLYTVSKLYSKIGLGIKDIDIFYASKTMLKRRVQFQDTPRLHWGSIQNSKTYQCRILKYIKDNDYVMFQDVDKCYRFYFLMSLCHYGSCSEITEDPTFFADNENLIEVTRIISANYVKSITEEEFILHYSDLKETFENICMNINLYESKSKIWAVRLTDIILKQEPFNIQNSQHLPTYRKFIDRLCDISANYFYFIYYKHLVNIFYDSYYSVSSRYCFLHKDFFVVFKNDINKSCIVLPYCKYLDYQARVCITYLSY